MIPRYVASITEASLSSNTRRKRLQIYTNKKIRRKNLCQQQNIGVHIRICEAVGLNVCTSETSDFHYIFVY